MRFLLVTILFLFIGVPLAQACKCYPPNNELAEQAYFDADIIIRAKVINPSKGFTQSGPILSVETLEVIKGRDVPNMINMNYNPTLAACGNHFEADDEAIMAVYDTRQLSLSTARGYGFRLMSSCQQDYVRHYLENIKKTNDLTE